MENLILSNVSIEDLAKRVAEKVNDLQKKSSVKDTTPEPDEFLTIEKACDFLNLAKATIYTLTCKKQIPYFKKGKKVYFKKSELVEWINSGKKQTREEIRETASDLLNFKRRSSK